MHVAAVLSSASGVEAEVIDREIDDATAGAGRKADVRPSSRVTHPSPSYVLIYSFATFALLVLGLMVDRLLPLR
jgi:hypothetical protein